MKKELRPRDEEISCDICARTMLKGERTEPYLSPGGERHNVCELCTDRALSAGWIRESAHAEMPSPGRGAEPRRSLRTRLRRRRMGETLSADELAGESMLELDQAEAGEGYGHEDQALDPLMPRRPRRMDPRHVHAVPTNAQVKVERALELFNRSEHVRTIAGIGRTLGEPWVSAAPAPDAASEVVLVVAWELSWYRYRIDLADPADPVSLTGKGRELEELGTSTQDWNASAQPDGRLAIGVPS